MTPAPYLDALSLLRRGEVRPLAARLLSRRLALGDWVNFLVDERLGVYAYALLAEHGAQSLVAGPAGEPLRAQWAAQQERDRQLLAELQAIHVAFEAAGIEFVLLKGLDFGERFYGVGGRRFTWDLDLLVRPADVATALREIDRLGFRKPRFTLGLERIAPFAAHALECNRPDGLSVDLHWTLRRLPGLRLDAERPWRDGLRRRLGEVECRVLADDDALLLLLLGIAADVDRSLCRVRSLWDASMLLRARPDLDWESFFAARAADRSLGLVANALALVVHGLREEDEFPRLTSALATLPRGVLTLHGAADAAAILERAPHSLANHAAFSRWQPLSLPAYGAWWATTLPLRFFFARRV